MNYNARHEFRHDNNLILATISRRFFAFLVDWIVLALIYYCIIILFRLININISKINVQGIFDVEIEIDNARPHLITILKSLLGFLPVLYFALMFYFCKGQTIGKYFLRIKILSLYHDHLGFWHCIERSLGYFASVLEFGFGYMQAFWNPNRMTLHDKIGETIVIELPRKKHSK